MGIFDGNPLKKLEQGIKDIGGSVQGQVDSLKESVPTSFTDAIWSGTGIDSIRPIAKLLGIDDPQKWLASGAENLGHDLWNESLGTMFGQLGDGVENLGQEGGDLLQQLANSGTFNSLFSAPDAYTPTPYNTGGSQGGVGGGGGQSGGISGGGDVMSQLSGMMTGQGGKGESQPQSVGGMAQDYYNRSSGVRNKMLDTLSSFMG